MSLQKLRDNIWAFSFQVKTPTDAHVYTVSYKTLAEAEANMQKDLDEITALGQVASKIKVAHAALASANSEIYEYCTHLKAHAKTIVVRLISKTDAPGRDKYVKTELPVTSVDDLQAVHAKHKANTAAHVAKIAANADTFAKLQSIGTLPSSHPLAKAAK